MIWVCANTRYQQTGKEKIKSNLKELKKRADKTEGDMEDRREKEYEEFRLIDGDCRRSKWMEKKNPYGRPLDDLLIHVDYLNFWGEGFEIIVGQSTKKFVINYWMKL